MLRTIPDDCQPVNCQAFRDGLTNVRVSEVMDLTKLSGRLKYARKLRGKSMQQIEDAVELTRGHLSRIESEQRKNLTPETIRKIARYLDVSYGWLADNEGPVPTESTDRYADQVAAVRLMALASGYDPEAVQKWEVALKLERAPTPDELWELFKDTHPKKTTKKKPDFSEFDNVKSIRKKK